VRYVVRFVVAAEEMLRSIACSPTRSRSMRRELLLLRQMCDAAVATRDLVGDRSAEEVEAETLRSSSLLWHFTVLGEAASQVLVETKHSHLQIAWRAASRLRNRIDHGYWDIDVETLVVTAVDDLLQMIGQLEGAISTVHDAETSGRLSDTGSRLAGAGASIWAVSSAFVGAKPCTRCLHHRHQGCRPLASGC